MVMSTDLIANVAAQTFHARCPGNEQRNVAPLSVFNGQPCMDPVVTAIV